MSFSRPGGLSNAKLYKKASRTPFTIDPSTQSQLNKNLSVPLKFIGLLLSFDSAIS